MADIPGVAGVFTRQRFARYSQVSRDISENSCRHSVQHFIDDFGHNLNFIDNVIQMNGGAYKSIIIDRPPGVNLNHEPITFLNEDIVDYITKICLFFIGDKVQRLGPNAQIIYVDFFMYGRVIIQDDIEEIVGFDLNGRRIAKKLMNIVLTRDLTARELINNIKQQLQVYKNQIDAQLDYDNAILFERFGVYVRPVNMLFGCGQGGTKVINNYLCFFPATRNKKDINFCFLGCIRKQFNIKISNQKIKYYKTPEFNIEEEGNITFISRTLVRRFGIKFPIDMKGIEKIAKIFRFNIELIIGDNNYEFMYGEDNENSILQSKVRIYAEKEQDNFHMGLILKDDPQLYCDICRMDHSLSKSKVSCMMTARNSMFDKLKFMEGVDNKLIINRLKLNCMKEYSHGQYFIPCDFARKKNLQEKYSINEVQAFDGSIFWDLEAYDSGEKNEYDFLEGQKAYAVGAAFSSFSIANENKEELTIQYYKDWYGENCMEKFLFDGLLNYAKEVGEYFHDTVFNQVDKKNKITLNLISFNGAGYDNHFLLSTLMDYMIKEDSPIKVIENSIVNNNGRIIGLKFYFKNIGVKTNMRQLNSEFRFAKKNPYYEKKRNKQGKIVSCIHKVTKEIINERVSLKKDLGDHIVFSVWDLAQFLTGSLASCGKSFGVPSDQLKTIFPHRLIRSANVISNDPVSISWHHFNPEDFNNKKKAKEVQKIYHLDPENPNSTSEIVVFPLIKAYLRQDVMTLKAIFSRFAYEIHANFNGFNVVTVMTGSQLSYKLWILDAHLKAEDAMLQAAPTLMSDAPEEKNEKIDRIRADFIPTIVPSSDDYDFIKASYTGGRTYPKERNYNSRFFDKIMKNAYEKTNPIFKYKDNFKHQLELSASKLKYEWNDGFSFDDIDDDLLYLDVNSLYPFVMANERNMPTGFYMGPIPINEIEKINEEFHSNTINCEIAGVFHCIIDTKGYVEHPLIRTRLKNGQNIWSCGKQETIITSLTIKYLISQGFDVEIIGGVRWEKNGNYLREYILNIYEMRKIAKKEGKLAKSNTLKLLMNSLYGKFAQRIMTSVVALVNKDTDYMNFNFNAELDQFFIKDEKLHILMGKNDYHKIDAEIFLRKEKPIVMASYITAGSRVWMQEYFDLIGRILYTDTDSLFAVREDVERAFGKDFKMEHPSKYYPDCKLKIDSSELGALKNECAEDEKIIGAIFAGAKFYGYVYINREGDIKYELKIKGIPQSQLHQQDLFDIFKDPTKEKEVNYFQMKKAGIIPHGGMELLTINRSITQRTVNKTEYSSMRYNIDSGKYETYSYQELIEPKIAEELVEEDIVEYTKKLPKKKKFIPCTYEAATHLMNLRKNTSFFPDDEINVSRKKEIDPNLNLITEECEFNDFVETFLSVQEVIEHMQTEDPEIKENNEIEDLENMFNLDEIDFDF